MTWDIGVAGTVHLDDITTPHGRRFEQLGGTSVYFALAAARFAPVEFSSICGRDAVNAVEEALAGLPVSRAGLEVVGLPTHRWTAVHDFQRWVATNERYAEGADVAWGARLPPAAAAAPLFFVGSMDPELQLRVIEQSSARMIGADSMTVFIRSKPGAVRDVAAASDILFCDRAELAALVPHGDGEWREAARSLLGGGRLHSVIVKSGPNGVAWVTVEAVRELPARPVSPVIDPTGAGDALAGGFFGACAAAERVDRDHFISALETGLGCAALAIGSFGTAGLRADAPAG